MIKIKIIAVGKIKEKYFADAFNEYIKRTGRYAKTEIIELKEENLLQAGDSQIAKALEAEGDAILKNLSGFVCALAIEGKLFSSEDFAQFINGCTNTVSEITFVIGSSFGLSGKVKERADLLISFSKMTFPHTMFRVILSEQVYRAFSIINNSAYHK